MEVKPEIQSYLDDCDRHGPINDGVNWFITREWAIKFKTHIDVLSNLAEQGDAQSQYYVACIYSYGYCYTSEKEFIDNYEVDIERASYWFGQSARNGHVQAIDNLISIGVGKEADRLRDIYEKYKHEFPLTSPPNDMWLKNLRELHAVSFKNI